MSVKAAIAAVRLALSGEPREWAQHCDVEGTLEQLLVGVVEPADVLSQKSDGPIILLAQFDDDADAEQELARAIAVMDINDLVDIANAIDDLLDRASELAFYAEVRKLIEERHPVGE